MESQPESQSGLSLESSQLEPSPSPGKSRWGIIAGTMVTVLAAIYAGRYLFTQFGNGKSEQGDAGDEFLIDSFEEGVFRQIQLGDYPQILVEDAEGKTNAYACSDGCPPLDQDPDLYLNRQVRVFLRNQATPGNDDPADGGIKVVVRVELVP